MSAWRRAGNKGVCGRGLHLRAGWVLRVGLAAPSWPDAGLGHGEGHQRILQSVRCGLVHRRQVEEEPARGVAHGAVREVHRLPHSFPKKTKGNTSQVELSPSGEEGRRGGEGREEEGLTLVHGSPVCALVVAMTPQSFMWVSHRAMDA